MGDVFQILHIGQMPQPWRWSALKNLLPQIEITESAADSFSPDKQTMCSLVDPDLSAQLVGRLKAVTSDVVRVGVFDSLIFDGERLWPRLLTVEAFKYFFSDHLRDFNLKDDVLLIGLGGLMRLCLESLARLGVTSVRITGFDKAVGERTVQELQKKYFSVALEFVEYRKVTELVGIHGALINTETLAPEKEWLDEFYFFNFLKEKGAVIDLNAWPRESPLIKEARAWGANAVSGDVFLGLADSIFCKRAFGAKIDPQKLAESLAQSADVIPFDTQSIIDRFRRRGQ